MYELYDPQLLYKNRATAPQQEAEPREPATIEGDIEKITAERDNFVALMRQELDFAKKNFFTAESIEKAQKALENAPKPYNATLASLRGELDKAKKLDATKNAEKLETERKKAQEYDERLKPELRRAWLEAGGSPDDFDEVYPTLKTRQIMNSMGKQKPARNDF